MNNVNNRASNPWIILKFGGNSVADRACWQIIADITRRHLANNLRPLIVCSALTGITNKLEKILDAAVKNCHGNLLTEIITSYQKLADELSVVTEGSIRHSFEELTRLVEGLALTQERTPLIQAKILAFGEIILTQIGTAYLQAVHFPITWCDARTLLTSIHLAPSHSPSEYLAAKCAYQKDEAVIQTLEQINTPVTLTQGFIARNLRGETVLLGRGGSDTAAAYLAAKINATRCEIWTDVPGVYSANPHEIPESRLLKSLDYDEAQEIASMGAKVLHPYCIPPLKANNIPLYVAFTRKPNRPGTEINTLSSHKDAFIKSILTKPHITLIQIETVKMWHQVGFLADVFYFFKQHNLSVDLVSTSETAVTVSLDLKIDNKDQSLVDALLSDLNTFCKATKIERCATISIVGRGIRNLLPKIGIALKIFTDQKIYLVSQASNDLNFSFVVDEEQALPLAKKLHAILIEENSQQHAHVFDRSWQEETI